jgi:hypothetical protein
MNNGSSEVGNTLPTKESRSLRDVRTYAEVRGTLLECDGRISSLLQEFGSVSQVDMEWKCAPSYPAPYIAELKDIVVIPGCKILLNAKGEALSDEIDSGIRLFNLGPKLCDMKITDGPCLHLNSVDAESAVIPVGIHLTGEHETNYFHWIVEILPRLFLFEKCMTDKQIPLLISNDLHANLYSLLDRIRATERPVLKLQRSCHYLVARLIYPSDVTRIFDTYDRAPGTDTVYLPVALLREMAKRIKRGTVPAGSCFGKCLYIRRNSGYRKLLNEAEIERLLVAKGFEVVETGSLSIDEQITRFSQARIIVGPSGAAMANMLWCEPGARVVILHSDHPFKKYPYWDALARAADIEIAYLAGPRAHNVTDIFEAHDDYTIMPDVLGKLLAAVA